MTPPVASIDRYRLVDRIGRGGMGEVYRAIDERLGRTVALKLLPFKKAVSGPRIERMHARMLREARAASSLNHPGIVTLHDAGIWRGRLYLVMELIEGERFTELAARGLPAREALRLIADAADALAAAHARGILHRDIKGDNLMRTRDGRVKVVDFGLATLGEGTPLEPISTWSPETPTEEGSIEPEDTDAPSSSSAGETGDVVAFGSIASASFDDFPASLPEPAALTRAGEVIGTPGYIAPERLEGARADERTEVYALGVVLRELLGAAPGADRPPRGAQRLVAAATAVDRHRRVASMNELARAARRVADDRSRRVVVLGAIAAGACLLAIGLRSGAVEATPVVLARHPPAVDLGFATISPTAAAVRPASIEAPAAIDAPAPSVAERPEVPSPDKPPPRHAVRASRGRAPSPEPPAASATVSEPPRHVNPFGDRK